MTETALPPLEPPRRLHFDWLLPALFRPRSAFAKIAAYEHGAWFTPLLLLTLLALVPDRPSRNRVISVRGFRFCLPPKRWVVGRR